MNPLMMLGNNNMMMQALGDSRNVAVNQAQSEFLLSQMGKWVANAPAGAAAYTAAK